jgi:Fe2+ or Zn2+ uptake regulation protein
MPARLLADSPAPSAAPLPEARSHAAALAEACRAGGLKATPQRIAILRVLRAAHDHPSAEQVCARVRESQPGVSLGTVYKALEALEQCGLISEVARVAECKRYDANLAPHHHLVCTDCGAIADHHDDALTPSLPASLPGFTAASVQVQIFGRCASCSCERAPPTP